MNYCFGIDIGGTTVKIGLFQQDGTVVEKWEIKSHTENEGITILPDIAASLKEKLAELKISDSKIIGAGIGVPAPVTKEGVVYGSANLGWKYKEVKHDFEELTGFNTEVGNDANMAALGEMWRGGGAGNQNMILITLGTGVGGGIILNGQVAVGENGAAGEIGHMVVDPSETLVCGCGKKGCLEQYASATGIKRLAERRLAKDNEPTVLRGQENSAKTVFDAVKAGDKVAIEVACQFGEILGRGLAVVATVTDPAIIVVGGGVSKAGEILFDYIKEPFLKHAFFANRNTKFALAELGNDAGIYGAAKLILK